eukprot:m.342513 g.342513  ORF g.342513 m.342513 type:complete len:920 (-) comp21471_c0_seq1:215-2974(-)
MIVAIVLSLVSVAQSATFCAKTSGLTIEFNASAFPVSLKNANGTELLGNGSPGFTFQINRTNVRFDHIAPGGSANEFVFSASSGEQLCVAFGGVNHYFTANFTCTHGFERGDGKAVNFDLVGKAPSTLRGVGLNFMVYDDTPEGHGPPAEPHIGFEAPWENSTWNPKARFAIYERIDDDTEDETLFDLWVDEGVPHPKVSGTWDRPTAKAWLQSWIDLNYDMSNMGMVPRNLSEWREFFPFGKLMDAKVMWFNFRVWDYTSIDNVNPAMFPTGKQGFKDFSDDAAKNGFSISSHRMSGGLTPEDPDYCVKPNPQLMGWGTMTLVNAIGPADTTIIVKPDPGTKIPTRDPTKPSSQYQVTNMGLGSLSIEDEWLTYTDIAPLPSGNWQLNVTRKSSGVSHSIGANLKGYLKGNEYFIPDLYSPLYETVAARYANFSNYVKFQDGSFDGAGWFTTYGRWGFYKFAALVYQNLDHPTAIHTSGLQVTPAWFEYRFNAVRTAFGGNFTTEPAGSPLQLGYVGRSTASLEEVTATLFKGLAANTRDYSVGTDMFTTLDVFRQVGNAKDILETIRDYKNGSLAMSSEQRAYMVNSTWFDDETRKIKAIAKATWDVEEEVFRKWVTAGTSVYHSYYYPVNSYIPPRLYTKNNAVVQLELSPELQSKFDRVRVTGRVLPRFDATSTTNIDLMSLMKVQGSLQISAKNPSNTDSWDDSRLKEYSIPMTNLKQHQGVGMFVDGDGSNGTLVVRVTCGTVARDFAVPLTFKGKQWVEVPNLEQGWRVRNWGPVGKGGVAWFPMNYSKADSISIGVGYLPSNSTSSVTVSGLQALADIEEPLVNPVITVGDKTVQTKETLNMYNQFTLDANGTFSVYDESWNMLSSSSVGSFRPTQMDTFEMKTANSTESAWLEIGVAGSTDTVPNPAKRE